MTPDARAPADWSPAAAAVPIDPDVVSRLAGCGPGSRWRAEVESAIAGARALIEPRVRWAPVSWEEADGLFGGGTPVEAIARRGGAHLFVATIGAALERRVRENFAAGLHLEAVLLDASGSAAVEGLSALVEREAAREGPSERFSPGYCMWDLEGQRRLFALLRPEEIGVRLLPSLLMHPLKSVSGVVVVAAREDLLVPEEICAQCDDRGCTRRRI